MIAMIAVLLLEGMKISLTSNLERHISVMEVFVFVLSDPHLSKLYAWRHIINCVYSVV